MWQWTGSTESCSPLWDSTWRTLRCDPKFEDPCCHNGRGNSLTEASLSYLYHPSFVGAVSKEKMNGTMTLIGTLLVRGYCRISAVVSFRPSILVLRLTFSYIGQASSAKISTV